MIFTSVQRSKIETDKGGFSMSFSSTRRPTRPYHCRAAQTLYNEGPRNADWVVDVSALRDLPLSFVSVLGCLAEKLKPQGREMRLSGACFEHLPPGYQEALTHCLLSADEFSSGNLVRRRGIMSVCNTRRRLSSDSINAGISVTS